MKYKMSWRASLFGLGFLRDIIQNFLRVRRHYKKDESVNTRRHKLLWIQWYHRWRRYFCWSKFVLDPQERSGTPIADTAGSTYATSVHVDALPIWSCSLPNALSEFCPFIKVNHSLMHIRVAILYITMAKWPTANKSTKPNLGEREVGEKQSMCGINGALHMETSNETTHTAMLVNHRW